VRLFSHPVSGFLWTPQPAKTRFYNNLKSFFEKQSRFLRDVPDLAGDFILARQAKILFRGRLSPLPESLYDWASTGSPPGPRFSA
jgi:hypothetical protein